jgi:chemotaxis protein MotB
MRNHQITLETWRCQLMLTVRILGVVLCMLLFAGCVSTKTHEASLSKISTLEEEVKGLKGQVEEANGKIGELQTKNASLKAVNRNLEDDVKRLSGEMRAKETLLRETSAELDDLRAQREAEADESQEAIAEMKNTYEALVSELNREIEDGRIAVTNLKGKLSLSMVDKILFDSGSAQVKSAGQKVLDRVGEILKKVSDRQILVEGHTDNVPIGSRLAKKFPSNWELSSQRATNVVRYLQDNAGIDPGLLGTAAYAQYKPVASNVTDEGKAKNRRIEIVLFPLDLEKVTSEE